MDLTGLSIEVLQEKLASAEDYDDRAAIRAELRKQKKERGVQSTAIIARKGASTYNRFGGSSDSPRGRAVTISISSTAKPKASRENQNKAKDDSAVRPVTSPQCVPDVDKQTTPVISPDPATTSDNAPVTSPPPVKSPIISPEPVTVTDEAPTKPSSPPVSSPEPVTTTEEAPVKSPPSVKSPSPSSSTHDEPDIGKKKTGQPVANKQPSSKQLSSAKTSNEKAEFQGFQLRKTGLSVGDKGRSNKNKTTSSTSERVSSSSTTSYSPAKTYTPAKSYAPTRNTTKRTPVSSEPPKQSGDVTADQLQQYLVAYVNQALSLDPPLPSAGRPFYSTCSQPDVICSLLNHAVPGTVDMRALSPNQEPDSRESNMMLALESARAIGCHIGEDSTKLIDRGEPQAIKQLVMDIVRAKVVHLPNMEDEPRETFEDPAKLFALVGVSVGSSRNVSTPDQFSPPPKSTPSPKCASPPTSRAATNKKNSFDTDLSYEERAALRRAEREARRRQREALS